MPCVRRSMSDFEDEHVTTCSIDSSHGHGGADVPFVVNDHDAHWLTEIRWQPARRGAREFLAVFREALDESAVRQKEAPVFHAHEAIQPRRLTRAIVAERRLGDLAPLTFVGPNPLWTIERLAPQ